MLNSLSAERKINVTASNETCKTTSLGSASRNNIIQDYRAQRGSFLSSRVQRQREFQSDRFTNYQAIARQRLPHAFRRDRGKLHWEEGVSSADMKAITHEGDKELLDAYIADNLVSLKAEAESRREKAKKRF